MSKIPGRYGRIDVSSDGGANWETFGEITDMSMSCDADTIDVSSHSTGQFREFLQGRKGATLDGSAWWDQADAGQAIVKASYFSGTKIDVRYRPEELAGTDEFIGKGDVTSLSPSSPNDDGTSVDFTIQLSGDFTPQIQS